MQAPRLSVGMDTAPKAGALRGQVPDPFGDSHPAAEACTADDSAAVITTAVIVRQALSTCHVDDPSGQVLSTAPSCSRRLTGRSGLLGSSTTLHPTGGPWPHHLLEACLTTHKDTPRHGWDGGVRISEFHC